MESEHCLQLGWQEEKQNSCRENEEGLSPFMVVLYYAAISVRGKSITIPQSVEEIK